MKGKKGLFAFLVTVAAAMPPLAVAQAQTVVREPFQRALYFGGGADYMMEAQRMGGDGDVNRMPATAGFNARMGWGLDALDVSLDAGFMSMQYDDILVQEYTRLPIHLNIGWNFGSGRFRITPLAIVGMEIDSRPKQPNAVLDDWGSEVRGPGLKAASDIALDAGLGAEIGFLFGTGFVQLVADASYKARVPLTNELGDSAVYLYPTFGIGVKLRPFVSSLNGGTAKKRASSGGNSSRQTAPYSPGGVSPSGKPDVQESDPFSEYDIEVRKAIRDQVAQASEKEPALPPAEKPPEDDTTFGDDTKRLAVVLDVIKQTAGTVRPEGAKPQSPALPKTMEEGDIPPLEPQPIGAKQPWYTAQSATQGATPSAAPSVAIVQSSANAGTKLRPLTAVQREQSATEIALLKAEAEKQRAQLSTIGGTAAERKENLAALQTSTGGVSAAAVTTPSPLPADGIVRTVFFLPNITNPVTRYSLPAVDEAGRDLQKNANMTVVIRGYSAPFGTADDQDITSESRARYVASYLNAKYGIDYKRMKIEWFGAAKAPASYAAFGEDMYYRAAEVVCVP